MIKGEPAPYNSLGYMFESHFPRCHTFIRRTALLAFPLLIVTLLSCGVNSDAEASFYRERIVEFPNLPGWDIAARDTGMCSARQKEENGQRITLFADPGTYHGGVWYLDVVSRNHRLKPGVLEAVARLSLDGKHVITGKALEVGDSVGGVRTATYVRIEFLAIDAHIGNIEAASVVEAQVDGLSPVKLGSLSPIIVAIRKCQLENSKSGVWK